MQFRKLPFQNIQQQYTTGRVKFPLIKVNEKLDLSKYHVALRQTVNSLIHRVRNIVTEAKYKYHNDSKF